jgi:apolipoprotein D and lipocalin family protein
VNVCREGTPDGPERSVEGTARSVNAPANTRLKVKFGGPFEGDYWVFRLNEAYTTAAVGSPDRNSLWILHRSPQMEPAEYQALVESLRADGFPVDRLERTKQ